jgi:hypothetical protein
VHLGELAADPETRPSIRSLVLTVPEIVIVLLDVMLKHVLGQCALAQLDDPRMSNLIISMKNTSPIR